MENIPGERGGDNDRRFFRDLVAGDTVYLSTVIDTDLEKRLSIPRARVANARRRAVMVYLLKFRATLTQPSSDRRDIDGRGNCMG